jgi:hypothetical protein
MLHIHWHIYSWHFTVLVIGGLDILGTYAICCCMQSCDASLVVYGGKVGIVFLWRIGSAEHDQELPGMVNSAL